MARPTQIVLVGLPGAGKSTVGPLVAEALGWAFVDLDREIERVANRSVAEIFRTEGEQGFRRREGEATRTIAGRDGVVLAPGGGWLLDPRNRETLGPGAIVVYLAISPETAAARLGASANLRPLLAGAEPVRRLRELFGAREPIYLQANHTVSVDSMAPERVADSIVALATQDLPD